MCKYKHGIFAALFFTLVIIIVFRKFFFGGLLPVPYNILVGWYFPFNLGGWESYHPGIIFKGGLFAADVFRQMIPWKQLSLELLRQGQLPLWNPYSFSGEPLLANPQVTFFYPLSLLFLLIKNFDTAWSIYIVLSPFLGMIFMYLFLRSLKLSALPAIIGSLAFSFSGHMVSWLQWGLVTHSAIWLPLMLYSLNLWLKQQNKWGTGLLLLSTFATFTGGYPQESAYSLLFASIYFIFLSISTTKKPVILKQAAILFAIFILLASPQIIPTFRLFTNSALKGASSQELYLKTRLDPRHLLTFFSADFYGNRITGNYWADQFTTVDYTDANLFIGSVAGFFVLLSLISLSKSHTQRFFLSTSIITVIFALKSPLTRILAQAQIPLLSTGVAAGILYLSMFSLAALSGFGLHHFLHKPKSKQILIVYVLYLLVVSLSYLFILPPVRRVTLRNLVIPITSVTALTLILTIYTQIQHQTKLAKQLTKLVRVDLVGVSKPALIISLLLLVSAEYTIYTNKILSFSPRAYSYPDHPLLAQVQELSQYDRVTGFWDSDLATNLPMQYQLYSAEGYNPLYTRSYAELFSSASSGKLSQTLTRSDADFPQDNQPNRNRLLDLTSTKYIVAKVTDPKNTWEQEPLKYNPDRFKLIWQQDLFKLYQNTNSLPRVSLYSNIEIIPETTKRISRMFDPDWDPHYSVILEENPHLRPSPESTGSAKITNYSPNQVKIQTDIEGTQPLILLLTDTYYNTKTNGPWKAYIDGIQTPIYRANQTFRAVLVKPGIHQIEFKITWP